MSTENFPSAAYDLSLIPPDEDDDIDDTDDDWADYVRMSRTLDVDDLMVVVGEMFSNSPLLRTLITETLANPFRPDARRALHINDAMKLGEEVATLIATACDDAVGLRIVIGGAG